jgi:hypothetical protein
LYNFFAIFIIAVLVIARCNNTSKLNNEQNIQGENMKKQNEINNKTIDVDIPEIVSTIKKMRDIVVKKDANSFLATQVRFYTKDSTDIQDMKSQLEGARGFAVWQIFIDIYTNINYDSLEKDMTCEFIEKQEGKTFERASICHIPLTIPKTPENKDPLAGGSYSLKVTFSKTNNEWHMLAPTVFDLKPPKN